MVHSRGIPITPNGERLTTFQLILQQFPLAFVSRSSHEHCVFGCRALQVPVDIRIMVDMGVVVDIRIMVAAGVVVDMRVTVAGAVVDI